MTKADPHHPARVVLASASVGAGHNQAAAAIAEALKRAAASFPADFDTFWPEGRVWQP